MDTTTAPFIVPDVNTDVPISITNTSSFSLDEDVFILIAGKYKVISIVDTTNLTVKNLGDVTNAIPTTEIPTGTIIDNSIVKPPPVEDPIYAALITQIFPSRSAALTKFLTKYPKGSKFPAQRAGGIEAWTVEDISVETALPPGQEEGDCTLVTLYCNPV